MAVVPRSTSPRTRFTSAAAANRPTSRSATARTRRSASKPKSRRAKVRWLPRSERHRFQRKRWLLRDREKLMDAKSVARQAIEGARSALVDLSHRIHARPEMGFEEENAAQWLCEALADGGYAV